MSSIYDLQGFQVSSQHAMALLINNIPVLFPNSTATIEFESGRNYMLAPNWLTTRGFVLPKPPSFPSAHLVGDIVINSEANNLGRDIYQLQSVPPVPQGNGQAALSLAWSKIGHYTSPAATIGTALTLDGGDSDDVDAAIVEAGAGNQLVLTGSFTLTRPIRLEGIFQTGQRLTVVLDSPTFVGTSGVAITTSTVGPTEVIHKSYMNNGVYQNTSPFGASFWKDILQNASFAL